MDVFLVFGDLSVFLVGVDDLRPDEEDEVLFRCGAVIFREENSNDRETAEAWEPLFTAELLIGDHARENDKVFVGDMHFGGHRGVACLNTGYLACRIACT